MVVFFMEVCCGFGGGGGSLGDRYSVYLYKIGDEFIFDCWVSVLCLDLVFKYFILCG